MKNKVALGIDIGGTNTKVGFFTAEGELIDSLNFPTQKESAQNFFKYIHSECLALLKKHLIDEEQLLGVGIGAPMANATTGSITYAHNLGWKNIEIKNDFAKLFKCPVFIDNDANLAALGESYFGVGRDAHSFILITLGTGVGTGIVINKKLIHGFQGLAGEGGHIIIDSPTQRFCPCGGLNHIEAYMGAEGILKTFAENDFSINIRDFSKYLEDNDPKAIKCLDLMCDQLSSAIVNMSVVIGPEKIILAGGVSQIGEVFLNKLEEKVNEKIIYSFKNKMTFHLASVSTKDGAIYGGAALVFSEVL
ncbi:MAG: ROK family protein [Bacteriovoracaceae bacterium]